ncbi:MAG: hypothetical protein V4812_19415 [Pseudomonadota bacterium]
MFEVRSAEGHRPMSAGTGGSAGAGRDEREPWLLASKLPESQWSAAQVVARYKRPLQPRWEKRPV